MSKAFSSKLSNNPTLAARAFSIYFGRRLPDLDCELRDHMPDQDEGDDDAEKSLHHASEIGVSGKRRLPFFKDPLTGKLRISERSLRAVYIRHRVAAERSCHAT